MKLQHDKLLAVECYVCRGKGSVTVFSLPTPVLLKTQSQLVVHEITCQVCSTMHEVQVLTRRFSHDGFTRRFSHEGFYTHDIRFKP